MIRNALLVFLLVVIAPLGMTAWDQYQQRQATEAELNRLKTVGCQREFRGRPLVYSAFSERDVLRPASATLSCYYERSR